MKQIRLFFLCLLMAFPAFLGAQQSGQLFISDPAYAETVVRDFNARKKLFANRQKDLLDIFGTISDKQEKQAMMFLYAYMPLSDLAAFDGRYFLSQVRMAFKARETFSWGAKVPGDVFRHFVLPFRVNNENPDSSRQFFYGELKNRVEGLDMASAALEVNHWCHEKVTYKSTDARTSGPLATVRTAYGRCGEESTFTVAALRSVGIPARQVYTPRWAHCDDNHAWVEVWIDGRWHFLGACEPEPALDMAWFSAPVLRAMLCNTTVFGKYNGSEEVLKAGDCYTQINLISNYAPSRDVIVRVVGADAKPLKDAQVEFQLYNYAEFYPLARKTTGADGIASLRTGLGDLMIWASAGGKMAYQALESDFSDTLTLVVNMLPPVTGTVCRQWVPPVERIPKSADALGRALNDRRLKSEDSIRAAYEATFSAGPASISSPLIRFDSAEQDFLQKMILRSRGNWSEISAFILKGALVSRPYLYGILAGISEKDLHDTPSKVLLGHLLNTDSAYSVRENVPTGIYYDYVLNPRISNELLSDYKTYFRDRHGEDLGVKAQKDPAVLVKYVTDRIQISTTANYARTPMWPVGVHELRMADPLSRDIYFVALCRSFGIPARIDPASGTLAYYARGGWQEVHFSSLSIQNSPKSELTLVVDSLESGFVPVYYQHFTIARFIDGFYRSLDYEESPLLKKFPATLSLDTGYYLILTGVRNADGSVNTRTEFFRLKPGEQLSKKLIFNTKDEAPEPVGAINLQSAIELWPDGKSKILSEVSASKGLILMWVEPGKEPTRHTLSDISLLRNHFEKWDGGFLVMPSPGSNLNGLTAEEKSGLPGNAALAGDVSGLLGSIEKLTNRQFQGNFPVCIMVDKEGKIIYLSSGYKIGRGEQMAKLLKYLK